MIKSKLDETPESKTFALLEKGGPDLELVWTEWTKDKKKCWINQGNSFYLKSFETF